MPRPLVLVLGALALLLAAVLPFAHVALGPSPWFLPAFFAVVVTADLATALVVATRFRRLGGQALLVAVTFAFSGMIVVPHALAFPGVVLPEGAFPAIPDAAVYLWVAWHVAFPVGLLVSALPVARRLDAAARRPGATLLAVGVLAPLAVAGVTGLILLAGPALPVLVMGREYDALWRTGFGPVVLAVGAACLAARLVLSSRRKEDVLDRWTTAATAATFADILLVLAAGERYSVGWYGARLLALAASGAVLVAVLSELGRLQDELGRAHRHARRSAERLRDSYALLQSVLHGVPDAMYVKDRLGRYLLVNPAAADMLGKAAHEVIGRTDAELLPAPLAQVAAEGDDVVLARQERHTSEGSLHGASDERAFAWTKVPYLGPGERVLGLIGVARDVTAERRTEEARRAAERRFQRGVEVSPIGVALLDAEGVCFQANKALARTLGVTLEQIEGRPLEAFAVPEDAGLEPAARRSLRAGAIETWQEEVSYRHAAGHVVVTLATLTLVDEASASGGYFIAQRLDVTERRHAQAELAHQALHDPLTGLPNRVLMLDRLEHVLTRRRRDTDRLAALLFVDLDRFKPINNSLGHEAGDQVLMETARRLVGLVRPGDTVASLGGDEFTILCDPLDTPDDAMRVAQRVLAAIERPLRVGDQEVAVSASVGIALAGAEDDAAAMLRDADAAMYQAKRGTQPLLFDASMREAAAERLATERDLRRAVQRDELTVVYQPQVELATGRVVGAEALVRWPGRTGRFSRPDGFIPVAEQTGLIVPLGRRVLERACLDARAIDLPISVNLSAAQLADPALADDVAGTLERTGLAPSRLQLELTESVVMRDVRAAQETLRALHELGVGIALDDFGTGYSTLALLQRLPVDTLKIDRSFVEGLGRREPARELVGAMIAMSDALNLVTVAEGAEAPEQAEVLRDLGCQIGQGYLFGRPQPADDLASRLASSVGAR